MINLEKRPVILSHSEEVAQELRTITLDNITGILEGQRFRAMRRRQYARHAFIGRDVDYAAETLAAFTDNERN